MTVGDTQEKAGACWSRGGGSLQGVRPAGAGGGVAVGVKVTRGSHPEKEAPEQRSGRDRREAGSTWLLARAAGAAGAKASGWILPGAMQEHHRRGCEAESTEQGAMSDGKAGRSTSGLWVSPRVGGDAVRGFRGEKQRNATYFYNIALAVVLKTDCKGTRAETGRAGKRPSRQRRDV